MPVSRTTFRESDVWERRDLQGGVLDHIEVLGDDLMVVAEEFNDWVHSDLRIDLLCIDRDANLVVIELKRDASGGHSELQAIRYASMVAPATFAQVVEAYRSYTARRAADDDSFAALDADGAQRALLEFLEWDAPDDERFGGDVRIILASTDFSVSLMSAVLWLRTRGDIDIRCIRLVPYAFEVQNGTRLIVDVQEERKREARANADAKDTRRFDPFHVRELYPIATATTTVARSLERRLRAARCTIRS